MELRQLRYFVTVVEEANFTRAAARLHLAQPGLSAQIRQLEHELGQQLLDRGGRSVTLTEVGAAVLPHARAALAATERITTTVDEFTGLLRGHGVPPHRSRLSVELRDWLRDCLRERPGDGPTPSADPALTVDVLYDVFQGAVMRRLSQEAAPHGAFTAEVDAAIALVLAGFASDAGHA